MEIFGLIVYYLFMGVVIIVVLGWLILFIYVTREQMSKIKGKEAL